MNRVSDEQALEFKLLDISAMDEEAEKKRLKSEFIVACISHTLIVLYGVCIIGLTFL